MSADYIPPEEPRPTPMNPDLIPRDLLVGAFAVALAGLAVLTALGVARLMGGI